MKKSKSEQASREAVMGYLGSIFFMSGALFFVPLFSFSFWFAVAFLGIALFKQKSILGGLQSLYFRTNMALSKPKKTPRLDSKR